MVTREKFIDVMTRLCEIRERESLARDALRELGVTLDMESMWDREELVVDALAAALDDTDDWIAYFLWERDGKLSGEPCVFESDGATPIDTSDWGKVYDMITADNRGEDVGYV